jgi:phosphoribosyl-ATP pyrophosphohydrolase/phosphoribosyl-AMP cyclohydrolase
LRLRQHPRQRAGRLPCLIPAIIQDVSNNQVLMIGFMNREAVQKTLQERRVTFWSRTKQRLWQKGETSGNTLEVSSIHIDCDGDALVVRANPTGPVCHTGTYTCFGEEKSNALHAVLDNLENIIRERRQQMPEGSYTAKLFRQGTPRIAQKVGEEAVETIVAALQGNSDAMKEESADLLYHLLVLLQEKGLILADVTDVLKKRMEKPTKEVTALK